MSFLGAMMQPFLGYIGIRLLACFGVIVLSFSILDFISGQVEFGKIKICNHKNLCAIYVFVISGLSTWIPPD